MAKQRYTVEQIKEALTKSQGFKTPAAKVLGCSLNTVENYVNRYPTLQAHLAELREGQFDFAEGKLLMKMKEGDVASIIFFLKTKAKERGYVEKFQLELLTSQIRDEQTDALLEALKGGLSPDAYAQVYAVLEALGGEGRAPEGGETASYGSN